MATHAELVRVFGEREVVTLDREDAEANGVPAGDAGVLSSVGLPATAGIHFTMKVEGDLEAMTIVPTQAGEENVPLLVLGGSPSGDPVRFCLDLTHGYVILVGLHGDGFADAEVVNSTLEDFVEFLYRIELREQELAGSTDEDARAYTEKLTGVLKALDPAAFEDDRLWAGLLDALSEAGAPVVGTRKAIRQALEGLLPGTEPMAWGTGAEFLKGIREISAHPAEGHWLLVTHGFSDLDGEADGTGLGFELTLRLPRKDEETPPGWALQALVKLGEYVFNDHRAFDDGHRMDIISPLGGDDGRLTALAFVEDPRLATIEAPAGPLTFLTAVGITAGELDEAKSSGTHEVVAAISTPDGLPITDPAR